MPPTVITEWTLMANGKGSDAALWGGDDQFEPESVAQPFRAAVIRPEQA
jgi:hypothetical protein